jgi:four helix bundle protein
MEIFKLSKLFPAEERYALTSQIRRSSRSVCLNLREAWAKRRYEPHFISKLTDCDGENSETDTGLDTDPRLTDPPTHRPTDSPTHRPTDSPTHRLTDPPTH